jgi:hypothetical protein
MADYFDLHIFDDCVISLCKTGGSYKFIQTLSWLSDPNIVHVVVVY